ncbi:hypothetical protein E2C01_065401 [Portunus trituberculatus]|uniref:Uncharacterized protein n=1 Tax=Portunus trituberculatus TaxID=210409 RepID=A0A5B7HEG9_PORTR|nr:hypothetical protein [Portunus trituberculatus]
MQHIRWVAPVMRHLVGRLIHQSARYVNAWRVSGSWLTVLAP